MVHRGGSTPSPLVGAPLGMELRRTVGRVRAGAASGGGSFGLVRGRPPICGGWRGFERAPRLPAAGNTGGRGGFSDWLGSASLSRRARSGGWLVRVGRAQVPAAFHRGCADP